MWAVVGRGGETHTAQSYVSVCQCTVHCTGGGWFTGIAKQHLPACAEVELGIAKTELSDYGAGRKNPHPILDLIYLSGQCGLMPSIQLRHKLMHQATGAYPTASEQMFPSLKEASWRQNSFRIQWSWHWHSVLLRNTSHSPPLLYPWPSYLPQQMAGVPVKHMGRILAITQQYVSTLLEGDLQLLFSSVLLAASAIGLGC